MPTPEKPVKPLPAEDPKEAEKYKKKVAERLKALQKASADLKAATAAAEKGIEDK